MGSKRVFLFITVFMITFFTGIHSQPNAEDDKSSPEVPDYAILFGPDSYTNTFEYLKKCALPSPNIFTRSVSDTNVLEKSAFDQFCLSQVTGNNNPHGLLMQYICLYYYTLVNGFYSCKNPGFGGSAQYKSFLSDPASSCKFLSTNFVNSDTKPIMSTEQCNAMCAASQLFCNDFAFLLQHYQENQNLLAVNDKKTDTGTAEQIHPDSPNPPPPEVTDDAKELTEAGATSNEEGTGKDHGTTNTDINSSPAGDGKLSPEADNPPNMPPAEGSPTGDGDRAVVVKNNPKANAADPLVPLAEGYDSRLEGGGNAHDSPIVPLDGEDDPQDVKTNPASGDPTIEDSDPAGALLGSKTPETGGNTANDDVKNSKLDSGEVINDPNSKDLDEPNGDASPNDGPSETESILPSAGKDDESSYDSEAENRKGAAVDEETEKSSDSGSDSEFSEDSDLKDQDNYSEESDLSENDSEDEESDDYSSSKGTEDQFLNFGGVPPVIPEEDKSVNLNDEQALNAKYEQVPNAKPNTFQQEFDELDGATSSHFMAYSLTAIILIMATYIMYHNKQKIVAIIIEGRTGGNGEGRRRRLNQNVSEAMPSLKGAKLEV